MEISPYLVAAWFLLVSGMAVNTFGFGPKETLYKRSSLLVLESIAFILFAIFEVISK